MSPLDKLAMNVIGWALVSALSFFFHPFAFVVVLYVFVKKFALLGWMVKQMKEVENDDDPRYEQLPNPEIDDSGMGSGRKGSLRKNVSENESRRHEGNLG